LVFLHELLAEAARVEPHLTLPSFEILPIRKINENAERALFVLITDCPEFFADSPLPEGALKMPRMVPFVNARTCTDRA
jgi:hypothetical protein